MCATRLLWMFVSALSLLACGGFAAAERFTVGDAIEMTVFELQPSLDGVAMVSPDGRRLAVLTERGNLRESVVESTIWIWDCAAVRQSLRTPDGPAPTALPLVSIKSRDGGRDAVLDVKWQDDSSGLVFLRKTAEGRHQLWKATIADRSASPISDPSQDLGALGAFDVRHGNAIYAVRSPLIEERIQVEQSKPAMVGSGHSISELLFPSDAAYESDWTEYWAVVGGNRFRVNTAAFQQPLHTNIRTYSALALSPDGRFAVTVMPLASVPKEWEKYPVPSEGVMNAHIIAGAQNLQAESTDLLTSQYMLIDINKGTARTLVDAPDGMSGGFQYPALGASWSADGRSVALWNTYLPPGARQVKGQKQFAGPCLAVVKVATGQATCIEPMSDETQSLERFIHDFHFASSDGKTAVVDYSVRRASGTVRKTNRYRELKDGSWERDARPMAGTSSTPSFEVRVEENPNDPPKLIAVDSQSGFSTILLDPNSKLRSLELGEASRYSWKDASGREWDGLLLKPPDTVAGHKYPLVIQSHGYPEDLNKFLASGSHTSVFAARPLAAAGIVVLQIESDYSTCPVTRFAEELPCQLAGYEAAIAKLATSGLIDAQRVGMSGFSRTVLYTMSMLSSGQFHFAAATVNDGFQLGYFGYLLSLGDSSDYVSWWMNEMIGAPPFGVGLKKWLDGPTEFNLYKVTTPLRVEAVDHHVSLMYMWEPYAVLSYLKKPVDFIVFKDGTHPLTNPAQRLISQGGTVDWMRFWLQGYEDPDPTKAEQYVRWRALRKLQETQDAGRADTDKEFTMAH